MHEQCPHTKCRRTKVREFGITIYCLNMLYPSFVSPCTVALRPVTPPARRQALNRMLQLALVPLLVLVLCGGAHAAPSTAGPGSAVVLVHRSSGQVQWSVTLPGVAAGGGGSAGTVWGVVNGNTVFTLCRRGSFRHNDTCRVALPADADVHVHVQSVATYWAPDDNGTMVTVPSDVVEATAAFVAPADGPPLATAAPVTGKPYEVGVLYSTWHALAYTAMAQVKERGCAQLTVEQLLRSKSGLGLNDVYGPCHVTSNAGFYYQDEPADGFYCIYRKRANESTGVVPDCPNITQTLTRHAKQLHQAGVTFVVTDSTNLGTPSAQADAIQTRPTEVLFEEWSVRGGALCSVFRVLCPVACALCVCVCACVCLCRCVCLCVV